jgi:hypothetical protein
MTKRRVGNISTRLQIRMQKNTSRVGIVSIAAKPKLTREEVCSHNLMTVTHKVRDHHFHHE